MGGLQKIKASHLTNDSLSLTNTSLVISPQNIIPTSPVMSTPKLPMSTEVDSDISENIKSSKRKKILSFSSDGEGEEEKSKRLKSAEAECSINSEINQIEGIEEQENVHVKEKENEVMEIEEIQEYTSKLGYTDQDNEGYQKDMTKGGQKKERKESVEKENSEDKPIEKEIRKANAAKS